MENETIEVTAGVPVESETVLSLLEVLLSVPLIGEYIPVIFGVVTAASAIAAITPTPAKGTWLGLIYTIVIDLPGLNVFKAKDKGDA